MNWQEVKADMLADREVRFWYRVMRPWYRLIGWWASMKGRMTA